MSVFVQTLAIFLLRCPYLSGIESCLLDAPYVKCELLLLWQHARIVTVQTLRAFTDRRDVMMRSRPGSGGIPRIVVVEPTGDQPDW
jgi:hypothetical protein